MKSSITFGVLFSTALAVGASAQSAGGQTPSPSGSSEQSQVTVMGCLQSGDAAGAAGGTGASGASSTGASGSTGSRSGGFVLTNAKMGSGPTSGSSGTSSSGTAGGATGSSASSGMAGGMTQFKLEGSQSDLQKYVNSQVEVTGKLDKRSPSGSSSTGSATTGATGQAGATGSGAAATGSVSGAGSGAGATGSAPGSRQDIPTLHVSRVRQVSPTCSGS
jgi:hypothetical protein